MNLKEIIALRHLMVTASLCFGYIALSLISPSYVLAGELFGRANSPSYSPISSAVPGTFRYDRYRSSRSRTKISTSAARTVNPLRGSGYILRNPFEERRIALLREDLKYQVRLQQWEARVAKIERREERNRLAKQERSETARANRIMRAQRQTRAEQEETLQSRQKTGRERIISTDADSDTGRINLRTSEKTPPKKHKTLWERLKEKLFG